VATPGEFQVSEVHAAQPPASELLAAMAEELDGLYEKVDGSLDSVPATPEQMRPPSGSFLLISSGSEPIACGGVKRLDRETAEIKRMYVRPARRGGGVARLLLRELERRVAELGYSRIRLDTGPKQPAARRIYESAGYRRIDDYNGNPYAAFWFEKRLSWGRANPT